MSDIVSDSGSPAPDAIEMASSLAVLGYAMFAFQQSGAIETMKPITNLDPEQPVAHPMTAKVRPQVAPPNAAAAAAAATGAPISATGWDTPQTEADAGEQQSATRSTVSMLQELSFLDD